MLLRSRHVPLARCRAALIVKTSTPCLLERYDADNCRCCVAIVPVCTCLVASVHFLCFRAVHVAFVSHRLSYRADVALPVVVDATSGRLYRCSWAPASTDGWAYKFVGWLVLVSMDWRWLACSGSVGWRCLILGLNGTSLNRQNEHCCYTTLSN
jgi:hypothetical protein